MLAHTRLVLDLTARQLTSREVVTIPQRMALPEAAAKLAREDAEGGDVRVAAVVDDGGRCVGMVSPTDLIRWQYRGRADLPTLDIPSLPPDAVGRYLSVPPVTATPETPLGELARALLAGSGDCILVTSAGRPEGLVWLPDVLAAVASEGLHEPDRHDREEEP
jgi:CBS domain-containing protein